MADDIAGFAALLDLERLDETSFCGSTMAGIMRTRVFGGHVAAQALVACGRTVHGAEVHSLHAYFLRPGDPAHPIRYEVEAVRDGRSFTTRRVAAIQHGAAIFIADASFHRREHGFAHAEPMPSVPAPEEIEPLGTIGGGRTGLVPLRFSDGSGLDVRYLDGPPWARDTARLSARERLWLRVRGSLGTEPVLHAAAITYASDLSLVGTILRRHPEESRSRGFRASLDHCIWFHRPVRADQWLLYDQVSPVAYGARGLARGELFTRDGELVVSVAQEGLVRSAPER